jgi:hypothetical protein
VQLSHPIGSIRQCFCTEATRHDNLAVLCQGVTNRVQALLDRVINKATGIHNNKISPLKCLTGLVTLCSQLRKNQLRVRQCLGTTQADEANPGRVIAVVNNYIH